MFSRFCGRFFKRSEERRQTQSNMSQASDTPVVQLEDAAPPSIKPQPTPEDALASFSKMIKTYEHRIGHATRAVSAALPSFLHDLPHHPTILDNACGTGAVTEELVKALPNARIYAADAVPAMVSAAQATVDVNEKLKKAVAQVAVMDGEALKHAGDSFDAEIMNFGIHFFPHPEKGASEAYRTLKPGGTALFTIWKTFGFKPVLWAVQDEINPKIRLTELPLVDAWADGSKLKSMLREGGFTDIEMHTVDTLMHGRDQEDLENVLLENFGAMVGDETWTPEEKAKLPAMTAKVLRDPSQKFTVHEGDKIGVKMTALVAVCKK